eukprot:TRINITY_DN32502_c0_g1_i1.p1 TRINITY_DN32502_c0_g1~~TRINITY_DN32502_c0_g1_i1.p1  ORF type:complete len:279 (+),score=51.71 TRINITY_DN32502_c0_g1_i1:56-838(+)
MGTAARPQSVGGGERDADPIFPPEAEELYLEALHWYWGLDGHVVNDSKAFRCFCKAARLGHPAAQLQLGALCTKGNARCGSCRQRPSGRCVWFDTASRNTDWFIRRAEAGDTLAQWQLSRLYAHGVGVPKDLETGARWCAAAARLGYGLAEFDLGQCYYDGDGVDRDQAEALKWCVKAAEKNLVEAQYLLGFAYQRGNGVEPNHREAVRLLRLASAKGHHSAQLSLAGLHKQSMSDGRVARKWKLNGCGNRAQSQFHSAP